MHVGSVMIFQPEGSAFDYAHLLDLISHRIAFAPRYRQKIRQVPGGLADPVWVDDTHFDITYHVRRAALPRPGSEEQLQEFVARVQPRLLDRARPLWEVYLVEGLAEGRFAIVTKAHHALVDGVNALDIAHLIVDVDDEVSSDGPGWRPAVEPSDLHLVADALVDAVRSPGEVVRTVADGVDGLRSGVSRMGAAAGSLATTLLRASADPAPHTPLNGELGMARRYAMVDTELAAFRGVRAAADPDGTQHVTVNDVVLAVVTGALRSWLLHRGRAVEASAVVRAMVPVSVYDDGATSRLGNTLAAAHVSLPVGEPRPAMRLHQISFAMRQQVTRGNAVGAESLTALTGFASPTLHSLGSRMGSAVSRRLVNLVVTNVPGPQQPIYAADARMLASYPVMPLNSGRVVSVGLTSYDGRVYFGLNGDRDAMPDLAELALGIPEALAELVADTTPPTRAQRGRARR